ncbi:HalOD1 output domain-containing protein [Halomontanus rarus]|uniref:HalOD1 output domain-containing protein n=1 Tax=Halomontanus rarus TaxID=3034020 RepID=UPI0023E7C2E3|nr:HalOD1 output domain-containing protein [Halovivax sp. TS33]
MSTVPSQTHHEVADSVSLAVVRAVASKTETDPAALPPLYDWIDPDALDALFAPSRTNDRREGTIEFTYDGSLVTISFDDNRTITVGETTQ